MTRVAWLMPLLLFLACGEERGRVARGGGEGREVDVAPLTGGRVAAIYVDEGDAVVAGDTIARLSMEATTAEVDAGPCRRSDGPPARAGARCSRGGRGVGAGVAR